MEGGVKIDFAVFIKSWNEGGIAKLIVNRTQGLKETSGIMFSSSKQCSCLHRLARDFHL